MFAIIIITHMPTHMQSGGELDPTCFPLSMQKEKNVLIFFLPLNCMRGGPVLLLLSLLLFIIIAAEST